VTGTVVDQRSDQKPLLHYFGKGRVPGVRSKTMSKIRGKNTHPELILRKSLWRLGFRFRIHDKNLPGTPDISNKSRQVVIFVDGCFWHGCPEHFKIPNTRSAFWIEKIRRNKDRRANVLNEYGPVWKVFEFYECDLKEDLDGSIKKISSAWRLA
jgi:DNA mismatch endonuclease, patch repair protein